MTKEQFDQFCFESIPQALFHVYRTDKDDKSGAPLDEVILIGLLNDYPEALTHKSLEWFVETYITSQKI